MPSFNIKVYFKTRADICYVKECAVRLTLFVTDKQYVTKICFCIKIMVILMLTKTIMEW